MAGRKPRYKSKFKWVAKRMTGMDNLFIHEEFLSQWRERLANLTTEDRELVATAMAGLDYKAYEEGLQLESNYFDPPQIDPLAYLDGIGDMPLYDRAIIFEIATLKAAKAIILDNHDDFYKITDGYGLDEDLKYWDHIYNLFFLTDLKGFWERENKSWDDIRNLYDQKQIIVPEDRLKGWLRHRGRMTKEEVFNYSPEGINTKAEIFNLSLEEINIKAEKNNS